jgi:hypothetical protein
MSFAPAVLMLGLALAPAGVAADHPEREHATERDQLGVVRHATERFRDVRVARRAGYVPAETCVAGPEGAMGVHYTHPRLARDRKIRIRRPEILVYEPHGHKRRLVAVEYYRADADGRLDTDDDRPYLFGRGFDGPMEGHEPGMPVHYDLHAWVWKRNPAGTFAQFNPRVECPPEPEAPDGD